MNISLILFDLDDTLWPCHPTIIAAEKAIFKWLSDRFPKQFQQQETPDSLRDKRIQLMRDTPDIVYDLTEVRRLSILQLCQQYNVNESLAEQGTLVFRHHRNNIVPFDDVIPVLSKLKTDYQLASVTNGNAEVEKTPLGDFFHHRITATDVGAAKPDPAIYLAACEAANIAPSDCLMVGDDIERDMKPAKQLGMKTLLIERNKTQQSANSDIDWVCKDLYCLQDLLESEVLSRKS